MVVLQGGLVIVCDGQGIMSLDQEVVVEAAMLKVMHCCSHEAGPMLQLAHAAALQHATMTQQHVHHLHDRRHVDAAVTEQTFI